MEPAFPESREDVCAALRRLGRTGVDEGLPLYQLQYQLASTAYAIALAGRERKAPLLPFKEILKGSVNISDAFDMFFASPCDAYRLREFVECLKEYTIPSLLRKYADLLLLHEVVQEYATIMAEDTSGKTQYNGICFLYAVMTSSTEAAKRLSEINQRFPLVNQVIAAKKVLVGDSLMVEKCNAILVNL